MALPTNALRRFLHRIHPVVHVLVLPVVLVTNRFSALRRNKKATKMSIGTIIMLTGTTMATHPVGWMPHFLWDAIAYSLHGYGLIPFLKVVCLMSPKLDLEHIDEEDEIVRRVEKDMRGFRRHRLVRDFRRPRYEVT
jgi:hypothetical protein